MSARVLVVDDERSMREFLEIFLRSEGHSVRTADGVAAARAELSADDFDVVITDVQMPESTGLDLLRLVQSESPETVVIVMTADTTTSTMATNATTAPRSSSRMRLITRIGTSPRSAA